MQSDLPLRIKLAGYNLDRETLDALKEAAYRAGEAPPEEAITPETLSAAYARISRNPADVGQIRAEARLEVERARKSNENIVFGLGHSSVAEHAVFNVDVTGISRLAVEAVQRHRLASFTEKSQRYIKLDGDYLLAPEIVQLGLEARFRELVALQNAAYFTLYPLLRDHFQELFLAEARDKPKTLAKAHASEDARYVVGLATLSQFGMTVNARTLEVMVRDGMAHPLMEVNGFAGQLAGQVEGIAPSLIKYLEATDHERWQFRRAAYWGEKNGGNAAWDGDEVRLLHASEEGQERTIAAMLVNQRGWEYGRALAHAKELSEHEKRRFLSSVMAHARTWDPPPREFELATLTYELVLSAAAYGQLKRHRMSTQITGPYDPSLGWTIPDSIRRAGGEEVFEEAMEASSELAATIAGSASENAPAAAYALTNAHRRRVLFSCNARELYHISRLREDLHAQWDIRRIAGQMLEQARAAYPLLMDLAVGKHLFEQKQSEVFRGEADEFAPPQI